VSFWFNRQSWRLQWAEITPNPIKRRSFILRIAAAAAAAAAHRGMAPPEGAPADNWSRRNSGDAAPPCGDSNL